jgi:hypothetical protein
MTKLASVGFVPSREGKVQGEPLLRLDRTRMLYCSFPCIHPVVIYLELVVGTCYGEDAFPFYNVVIVMYDR